MVITEYRSVIDKLGNVILLPEDFERMHNLASIKIITVLTDATFIIEERGRALHFFRLVDYDYNVLLSAELQNGKYILTHCHINPSRDIIRSLVLKGNLIPL